MLVDIISRGDFIDSTGDFYGKVFGAEFFEALWTFDVGQLSVDDDRGEVRRCIVCHRREKVLVLAVNYPRTHERRYGKKSSIIDMSSEKPDAQRLVRVVY